MEPSDHDSEYFSSDKVAAQPMQRRSKHERSKEKEAKQQENQRNGGSPQKVIEDLEHLKQKKIEEIKNMLIKERTGNAAIQPYKDGKLEEAKVENKKYNSRDAPSKSPVSNNGAKGH